MSLYQESFWESKYIDLIKAIMSFLVGTVCIIVGVFSLNNNIILAYAVIILGIIKYGLSIAWIGLYLEWYE